MELNVSKEEIQVENQPFLKCSTSLSTKEMQIKDALVFHLTPLRRAIIRNDRTC